MRWRTTPGKHCSTLREPPVIWVSSEAQGVSVCKYAKEQLCWQVTITHLLSSTNDLLLWQGVFKLWPVIQWLFKVTMDPEKGIYLDSKVLTGTLPMVTWWHFGHLATGLHLQLFATLHRYMITIYNVFARKPIINKQEVYFWFPAQNTHSELWVCFTTATFA